MLQALHLRHPDSAWLASKIHLPIQNIGDYERMLVAPWKQIQEARRVAAEVAEGRQMLKLEGRGINQHEARAIHLLAREQPVECEILAADLGKRGDKARWMCQQARQGPPMDGQIGEGYVNSLSERWTQRVSAFKLISQLEKQPSSAEPLMTFAESRSLDFLHQEGMPEARQMAELFENRNACDGWMAGQLLKRRRTGYDEYTTAEFHRLQNRAEERQQAYRLLEHLQSSPPEAGAWNLRDEEVRACRSLSSDDPEAASRLGELLSGRGAGVAWALQRGLDYGVACEKLQTQWEVVLQSRHTLEAYQEGPFQAREAEAIRALADLSPDEARAFQARLQDPGAGWACQKLIDSAHMEKAPTLTELESRWQDLVQADQALSGLKERDPGLGPISWEEARALSTWRANYSVENSQKSKQLVAGLKSLDPGAGWLCERLQDQQDLTAERFAGLVKDYQGLAQARQQAAQFPQGPGLDLTLAEANALLTIDRLGEQEEQNQLRGLMAGRGSRCQLALALLPRQDQVLTPEQFAQVQQQVEARAEVLAIHQAVTATAQTPVPEGEIPFSTQEIGALIELQECSWALAHSLRQGLRQRSDFAQFLPQQKSDWNGGDLQQELVKHHDEWMLKRAYERLKQDPDENPRVRERYFHLGSYAMDQPLGLKTPEQAAGFVRIWQQFDDRPNPDHILKLSQVEGAESLSPSTLDSLLSHLRAGGGLQGLDAQKAEIAAKAWQVDAAMPVEKALELGVLPLAERLNGGPGSFNKAQLVLGLPAEKLPLAIELTQAKSLTAGERLALYSGLRQSPEPQQALLNLKGAAFKEALQAICTRPSAELAEGELSPHDYRSSRTGWEERGAVALALTFRGSWRQWLDAQARIRGEDGEPVRTIHDVVDILPLRPLPGLDSFLLKNSHEKLAELSQIIGRWDELSEAERGLPFDEVLALARARVYPHMEHPEFGAEAARWGVSEQQYAELESRFIASQQVPGPFQAFEHRRWQQGEFSGRFLPRQDVRGLFLGNHTNCCQHPNGAGASCAYHGQESPRGGFFVLENAKGEVVVQSWAWVSDSGGLVFDNVEGLTARNKSTEVRAIYQAAAQDLVKKFPVVTMGLDHGKLPVEGWPATTPQTMQAFDGYSDAEKQVLLASA
ncbi:MAG: hypothetical protein U0931_24440 [Vulcanimicrobiota bacterium]